MDDKHISKDATTQTSKNHCRRPVRCSLHGTAIGSVPPSSPTKSRARDALDPHLGPLYDCLAGGECHGVVTLFSLPRAPHRPTPHPVRRPQTAASQRTRPRQSPPLPSPQKPRAHPGRPQRHSLNPDPSETQQLTGLTIDLLDRENAMRAWAARYGSDRLPPIVREYFATAVRVRKALSGLTHHTT